MATQNSDNVPVMKVLDRMENPQLQKEMIAQSILKDLYAWRELELSLTRGNLINTYLRFPTIVF